jgi:broad specificity phosphatase PhoE
MAMKTVFLVRHGTPDWSRRDIRYDIPPGPALVDKGHAESRLAGEFLRAAGVSQLFASPMDRAAQTAASISELLRLSVTPDTRLTEWTRDEKSHDVLARMLTFWQEQIEYQPAGVIALVSHGGPIRVLLEHFAPDLDLKPYTQRFDHGNCTPPAGIWCATQAEPAGPWRLALVFTPEMVGQLA